MLGIIYSIFVAGIIVGSGLYFGPCTIRQYCAVILCAYVAFHFKKVKGYAKLLHTYAVFIFLYGISALFDSGLSSFLRQFIALYLVSIVGYYATIIVVNKYKTLDYFLNSFIIVGILNGVVTCLQYCSIPIGYEIGGIFVDLEDPVQVAKFSRMLEGDHSNLFGIVGDIVYNGYYSMVLPFALLLRFQSNKGLFQIILVSFSLISLFFVGERSSFGITLILLLFYFYLTNKKSPLFYLVCFGVVFLGAIYITEFFGSDLIQQSRWATANDSARASINSSIVPFILSHPFLGGVAEFVKTVGWPPHNVIASGFIYAGLVGGICVIYMLICQTKISMRILDTPQNILVVMMFASYTLNGLFHNPAIVTGDAMVWILWAMVYISYKKTTAVKTGLNRKLIAAKSH